MGGERPVYIPIPAARGQSGHCLGQTTPLTPRYNVFSFFVHVPSLLRAPELTSNPRAPRPHGGTHPLLLRAAQQPHHT